MQSKNTTLNKTSKEIYKKNKTEVEDIILFGSFMKGKEKPKDIDLLIIFKNKINKQIETDLKSSAKIDNLDVNSTTLKELSEGEFIAKEGIYLEGKSLIKNKNMSESIGFSSIAFIKYDLSNIKGSERTKFYYALQGRGGQKGFLEEIGAKRYAESIIICEYSIIEKMKPFFEHWNMEYTLTPALVPKRLKRLLLS